MQVEATTSPNAPVESDLNTRPTSRALVPWIGRPGLNDIAFNTGGSNETTLSPDDSSGDISMVGPDGTTASSTATYVRIKTKVTNHRRVMYRRRRAALHSIVAEIKLRLFQAAPDRANLLAASKMALDLLNKHGVHPKDKAMLHPRIVAHVFIPSDDEIIASDISKCHRARQRVARMKQGNQSLLGAIKYLLGFGEDTTDIVSSPTIGFLGAQGLCDAACR
jgi:hypothetical protein